jgi:hypothetical protein
MPLLTAALEDICIEAATDMFDAAGYPRSYTHVRTQLQYGEETITERLLLDLTRRMSRPRRKLSLRVISIAHDKSRGSQYAEPKSGADWEWLFGHQGKKWFKVRVQAKRAKSPPGAWGYHSIGQLRSNQRTYQIDDLISDAGKDYWPIYALYDNQFLSGGVLGSCKACPRTGDVFRGVSYADARSVRALKAINDLGRDAMRKVSAPMPCLVDCPQLVKADRSLPARVQAFAARLAQDSASALRERGLDGHSSTVPELVADLPPHVAEILNRIDGGGGPGPLLLDFWEMTERYGLEVDEEEENAFSRLGGIVVINDHGDE